MSPALVLGGAGGLLLGTLACLVGSCGGKAFLDPDGSTGSGGATSTTTGTTATGGTGSVVPPHCEVPTSAPPPHAVSFQLYNPTAQTLFIREECWIAFAITSCADDYAQELELWPGCSMDCADPAGGCVSCEMCWETGIPIEPGQSFDVFWPGHTYSFGTNADGCTCHDEHDEPAGLHRIRVPVYLSAEAAEIDAPDYDVTVEFALPTPQGQVRVSLDG